MQGWRRSIGKLRQDAAFLGALFAVATAILTQPLRADEISDLDDMYESMVAIEAHLLDERRAAEDALSAQNAILLEQADGSIVALPRNTARDTAGMLFDWAQHWDLTENLRPFLPDEAQSILDLGVQSGFGRIAAVDKTVAVIDQNQAALRDRLRRQLGEIERVLEEARTIAASAIAERDALIAARDAQGVIDGGVCFHDSGPADGEALVASIGYGGAKFPVKGPFICTGFSSFLWDSGATIREFRCSDRNASPPVCSLFSEMAYEVEKQPDTGYTIYRLEDQRTSITFFFK